MSKNNNDVVIIELDRPREMRYGHKALKLLVAMTGKSLEEIENGGFDDFEVVEKMVYCGLLNDAKSNSETLELEQMEDLLDQAPSYIHIVNAVRSAFLAAWGVNPDEQTEGNQPQPGKEPAKKGSSTSAKVEK